MKCLLCDFKSNEKSEVENHYLNFHNVDKNNIFFQRLFDEKNNVFHGRRCVRCEEFILTTKFKLFHHFLKHYSKGKNIVEENHLLSQRLVRLLNLRLIIKIILLFITFIIRKVLLTNFYLM